MQSAMTKHAAARTHATKLNWKPATAVTTAATDWPSTTMKKVPNRSVRCETTIGVLPRVPQANGGTQRSIPIATPQRMTRYGSGTAIETSQRVAVKEKAATEMASRF